MLDKKIKKTTKIKKSIHYHDNDCPSCGNAMKEKVKSLIYPVNGEDIHVPSMPHLACPKCKEIILRLDEAKNLREKAIELYRKKYNLLSSEEIRSIRDRLDISQTDLAELLRLGVNSISRWEIGKNVQTAAMDILLRIIRDVPQAMDYLKKIAA